MRWYCASICHSTLLVYVTVLPGYVYWYCASNGCREHTSEVFVRANIRHLTARVGFDCHYKHEACFTLKVMTDNNSIIITIMITKYIILNTSHHNLIVNIVITITIIIIQFQQLTAFDKYQT